jgi:ABC-2 type transport system ATP-binding protein
VIVEISGLTKIYRDRQQSVTAVDGIDLAVAPGELFGLLGPNGAGKTTTIGICTTRTLPTSGQVRIAGVDVVAHPAVARRSIGVVPQYNTLDRSLTIFENLYFHCKYFGFSGTESSERANSLLDQFHLLERAKSFPSQLSGGLQQRVQIARAIAHRPAVLFLDEPSAGLDPQSRIAMWDAVRGLRAEGITVVLTTHYMEEADELCERVAIIDHGKVLALDSPERLKTTVGAHTRIELSLRSEKSTQTLADALRALPQIRSVEPIAGGLRLFAQGIDGLLPELVQAAQGHGVRDISINAPSLETVFIQLTGRDLRE